MRKTWIGFAAALLFLHAAGSAASAAEITGDCNSDGACTIADAVLLSRWLTTIHDTVLPDPQAADLNADRMLSAADLSLLKQRLLKPPAEEILVKDISGLFQAMRSAKPGDVIRLAAGTYDYSGYQGAQKIDTSASGTKEAPITLTAADPEHPPVLTGSQTETGYVLHIQGEYWVIENLIITTSQKGIVLDHASHSVIRNCEISNTGAEAVALRDGSSYCTVSGCSIHDTGLVSPGYGEGVYVGSAKSTSGFDYHCDSNKIENCVFQNIAAEHIDVKEYTAGTEICGCTFYGDGMTGENYAGSFVDIAGNACSVHDNTGYRRQNPKIVAAFEIHEQVEGWGHGNVFRDNTVYLDQPYGAEDTSRKMYFVDGWFTEVAASGNRADYGSGLTAVPEAYFNVKKVNEITTG